MWNSVLDSWFARNEVEHNLDNNATEISKKKLIEQISWLNSKIDHKVTNPCSNITEDEMRNLPKNNLNIMVDQINNIYMRDRLNPAIDDIS